MLGRELSATGRARAREHPRWRRACRRRSRSGAPRRSPRSARPARARAPPPRTAGGGSSRRPPAGRMRGRDTAPARRIVRWQRRMR
eukprot:2683110-Prymnesium_polylepis.1